jgi:hypothetical protein
MISHASTRTSCAKIWRSALQTAEENRSLQREQPNAGAPLPAALDRRRNRAVLHPARRLDKRGVLNVFPALKGRRFPPPEGDVPP